MALERTYVIPLRREWLKVSRNKRAKKAVTGLKKFLSRHMKQDDPKLIKLGAKLNEALWARGMRNPPHKVKVTAIKEDDGLVKAELFGHKYIVKKKAEKKEEEGGIAGKLKAALGKKDMPEKAEEEKKEETKKEEKPIKKPAVKKEEKKEMEEKPKEAKEEEKKAEKKEISKEKPKKKKKEEKPMKKDKPANKIHEKTASKK